MSSAAFFDGGGSIHRSPIGFFWRWLAAGGFCRSRLFCRSWLRVPSGRVWQSCLKRVLPQKNAKNERKGLCPQMTQINADAEKEFLICVRLRGLRASPDSVAFSRRFRRVRTSSMRTGDSLSPVHFPHFKGFEGSTESSPLRSRTTAEDGHPTG